MSATKNQYLANLSNHNANQYNSQASFVYSAKNTSAVLQLLDAKPGEKIIDLGCGTGEITEQIQQIVGESGEVWGLDSSQDMVKKAEVKSSSRVKYVQGDIQTLVDTAPSPIAALKGQFDAVFSSAVLHWCKDDPEGAVKSIQWLLKPGGRFAFEFGGFSNVGDVRNSIHMVLRNRGIDPVPLDPWYFPTDTQYGKVLEQHGFSVNSISLNPRPTPLTSDLKGWLKTFARNTFLQNSSNEEAEAIMDEMEDAARPGCYWNNSHLAMGRKEDESASIAKGAREWGKEEGWSIMYVRLRGLAIKSS